MLDPYHKWLQIPKEQRPPTYYQLLGIAPTETDAEVMEEAALMRMQHVRNFQRGEHSETATRILTEISLARQILSDAKQRKAYDAKIGLSSAQDSSRSAAGSRPSATCDPKVLRVPQNPLSAPSGTSERKVTKPKSPLEADSYNFEKPAAKSKSSPKIPLPNPEVEPRAAKESVQRPNYQLILLIVVLVGGSLMLGGVLLLTKILNRQASSSEAASFVNNNVGNPNAEFPDEFPMVVTAETAPAAAQEWFRITDDFRSTLGDKVTVAIVDSGENRSVAELRAKLDQYYRDSRDKAKRLEKWGADISKLLQRKRSDAPRDPGNVSNRILNETRSIISLSSRLPWEEPNAKAELELLELADPTLTVKRDKPLSSNALERARSYAKSTDPFREQLGAIALAWSGSPEAIDQTTRLLERPNLNDAQAAPLIATLLQGKGEGCAKAAQTAIKNRPETLLKVGEGLIATSIDNYFEVWRDSLIDILKKLRDGDAAMKVLQAAAKNQDAKVADAIVDCVKESPLRSKLLLVVQTILSQRWKPAVKQIPALLALSPDIPFGTELKAKDLDFASQMDANTSAVLAERILVNGTDELVPWSVKEIASNRIPVTAEALREKLKAGTRPSAGVILSSLLHAESPVCAEVGEWLLINNPQLALDGFDLGALSKAAQARPSIRVKLIEARWNVRPDGLWWSVHYALGDETIAKLQEADKHRQYLLELSKSCQMLFSQNAVNENHIRDFKKFKKEVNVDEASRTVDAATAALTNSEQQLGELKIRLQPYREYLAALSDLSKLCVDFMKDADKRVAGRHKLAGQIVYGDVKSDAAVRCESVFESLNNAIEKLNESVVAIETLNRAPDAGATAKKDRHSRKGNPGKLDSTSMPGSAKMIACNNCNGTGRIDCKKCVKGMMDCTHCVRGKLTKNTKRPIRDIAGNVTGYSNVKEKVNCTWCHGKGKVTCNECFGKGDRQCPECFGSGKVRGE